VALGFDQIRVRVAAGAGLAAEPPGGEDNVADVSGADGGARAADRLGVPVVEVDREEQVLLFGGGE
jgi:hypothetical protein